MKNLIRMIGFVLCCLFLSVIFAHPSAMAATQAQIEAAITNGINWLVSQQDVSGYWEDDMSLNRGGTTGLAVLKLEDRAYELGYSSPFDPAYPYSQNVEDGLAYLFGEANSIAIANQPAGNPDTDGDGIGVYIATDDHHSSYETGIAMMAITASRTPNRIVNSPGSPVNGWTYEQVVQDMSDYLAFGQCDSPNPMRGGWDYEHNTGFADNSNSGYAVLGLGYAEATAYGFNCAIPAFVKNELSIWIDYIQNDVDGDAEDGGSGYTDPCDWVNILKTGSLIFEMTFFGDSSAVQRVQDALDYLGRTWNDASIDPGWGNPNFYIGTPHYQAMYCIMKGLEYAGINTIYVGGSPTDWYSEFADAIVNSQQVDGSWPQDEWGGTVLASAWALLTLEKTAPQAPNVKWEQPPCLDDPNCMDVDATDDDWLWYQPQVLADDFLCSTTGPITDIHVWGSWLLDEPPDYDPNYVWFTLCLYSNDPCGDNGWSEPNELLWMKEFHTGGFDVEMFAEGPEGFYIPCEELYQPDSDWTCWLYSFYIDPCEAFVQEEGTIYWLAVQAHIYEPEAIVHRFGWKNSSEQWNDDAVWAVGELPYDLGPWVELYNPITYESMDLAFKITTVVEEEPVKPAISHLKWSQPPIEKYQPAALLYGSSPNMGTRSLSTVDPFTGLVTIIGPFIGAPDSITEIEWSPDGSTLYGTTGGGTSTIHTIDPTTGIILSTVVQIPAGTALQGLEFDASGTLLATSFPNIMGGSDLVQVNPATGVLITIGATGYNQIGGLAFDSGFNTLYGITSGSTVPPILLSVNPSTGVATPIAVTTMTAEASSLEFTADGRLVTAGNDGNFYEIDPTNGIATLIGPLVNEPKLSGLSLRPTPVVYWGWDETSYNLDFNEPCCGPWPCWKMVADDFRCLGSMPVGSIHWWGSHYGWEDTNELPPAIDLPEAWLISIWSNVPEGFVVPYSYPEELLWQIEVDANRVAVSQVGTDEFCTVYPNDVTYQYYLDLEPNEYFWQKDFEPNTIDDIFWLSIAAIYLSEGNDPYEPPEHPWGWKTRPWSWMDDAVTFRLESQPVLGPRMERVVDYTRQAGDPQTPWSGFRALYIWNDIMQIGDSGFDLFGHYDGMTFTYDADLGGSCIYDFEVYNNELYACAYLGNVHRSSDGITWTEIRGDQPNHSWELEAFQGYLYVSTGPNLERYDGATFTLVWTEPSGYEIISMLNDGSNLIIGVGEEGGYGYSGSVGKVYSYDGMTVNLISGNMGDGIQTLLESGGVLYAGGSNPGVVYEYLGGNLWQIISPPLGTAVLSLCEFEGDLYAGTMNGGRVWRHDGVMNWTQIGGEIDDQVYSLIVYQGSLYAGTTSRGGRLYIYNPDAPSTILDPYSITPIKDPIYYESYDVAFELDTDPDYIKWEQPFTGIRDWPHYEDEPSLAFAGEVSAIKYVQQPDLDLTGMDVLAGPLSIDESMEDVYEVFLADDFLCTQTGLITDIHLWASYNEDIILTDTPWFSLVIYQNIPADESPTGYSIPGAPLWDAYLQPSSQWVYSSAEEFFYDPNRTIIGFDTTVWRFDFEIDPAEAFVQEEGEIYWLGVHHSFDLTDDGAVNLIDLFALKNVWPGVFGWKTSLEHFEDDGVWTKVMTWMGEPHVVPWGDIWNELRYPIGHPFEGESIDLAFEITTKEPGVDILRLVADDWKCERRTPVTAIAWYGSYLGYGYNAGHIEEVPPPMTLPVKPDFFRLNIWTDVPEDACVPASYSHPNEIIWEYDAYDYDEVLVGYDKHPEGEPNEAVFRYSVRLPEEEWFKQPDVNNIYWLSIVAVYDTNMPNYDWGWTNHKHMFKDNAVEGYFDPPAGWFWYELYDQTGETEDMSFILFTDPNECVDCADYNLDGIVNFYDYAIFSLDWMWTGLPGGYANGDLNCNGKVEFEDLEIFCQQWLDSCP